MHPESDFQKLFKMENLAQWRADRTVVGIRRHNFDVLLPPLLTDFRRSDGRPLLFAFDLRVAEELSRFGLQEDRVVRHTVVFEDLLQLRPDRIVAVFVFLLDAGVDRHNEGFADFHDLLV